MNLENELQGFINEAFTDWDEFAEQVNERIGVELNFEQHSNNFTNIYDYPYFVMIAENKNTKETFEINYYNGNYHFMIVGFDSFEE